MFAVRHPPGSQHCTAEHDESLWQSAIRLSFLPLEGAQFLRNDEAYEAEYGATMEGTSGIKLMIILAILAVAQPSQNAKDRVFAMKKIVR